MESLKLNVHNTHTFFTWRRWPLFFIVRGSLKAKMKRVSVG